MAETGHIIRLFESFCNLNVMIIGDVMMDSYLWGNVERISPEAPVPIVALRKRENRLGGAANVALNIKALGAKPILCSVIGNDQHGDSFLELMNREKMTTTGIIRDEKRLTTTKFRIIGNHVQMLRVDEEMQDDLIPSTEEALFESIRKIAGETSVQAIILQDYNKGILTPSLISNLIAWANEHNIPICVDPKRKNFSLYQNITLFKPNLKELREGLELDIESGNFAQIEQAIALLQSKQKIRLLLVTLSEHGLILRQEGQEEKGGLHFIPAHKRSITDVSGAGDTVISLAALCLAAGCYPKEIAAISNLGGGLVCEEVGVVPIDKEKLMKEMIELL